MPTNDNIQLQPHWHDETQQIEVDYYEKKFKQVNEAYQVLSDDTKRSKYDQFGSGFENVGQQGGYGGQGKALEVLIFLVSKMGEWISI